MSYMSAMYKNMLESLFEDLRNIDFTYTDCSTGIHSGYYCNGIYLEDYPSDASIDDARLNKQLDALRETIKNIFNDCASSYPVEKIIRTIHDRIHESKSFDDVEEDLKNQIEQLCISNFMHEA